MPERLRQAAGLKLLAAEVRNRIRFHQVASRAIGNVQHAKFTGVSTPGSVYPEGRGAGR
jgi:hypothetical protein